MKLNYVQTILAIAISILIAYGLYSLADNEHKMILSAGSFVFFAITLIITLGARFSLTRTTTNVKVVGGIFFLVAFISNLTFTFIEFSAPSYFIVNGILALIFILIIYSINQAKQ